MVRLHPYLSRLLPLLAALVAIVVFIYATAQLQRRHRVYPEQDVAVVLPRFMQVLMTGGDRYLAANVVVVRTLLNPTRLDTREHYAGQAKIQVDGAWLNPRHEDNYYLAAGYLSWSGYVSEAEEILQKAAATRPFDMMPPFFLAFDYFYFDHEPVLGAQWMYRAAKQADSEQNRVAMSRIAARWAERGQDAREALRVVRVMMEQSRGQGLKAFLALRAQRLEGLVILQQAARDYQAQFAKPATGFDELIKSGLLKQMPLDPLGLGYNFGDDGIPQLVQPPRPRPATKPQQR